MATKPHHFLILFFACVFAWPSFAAGTKDGGGGIGVACDGRVRTLDLFEAETIRGVRLGAEFPNLDSNIKVYGARMKTYFSTTRMDADSAQVQQEALEVANDKVLDRFVDLPKGKHLPLVKDATLPPLPAGCTFVQIAFFLDDEGVILRDRELWDQLSLREKTALILHESLYHWARYHEYSRPHSSDSVRILIGDLVSANPPAPQFLPLWDSPRVGTCLSLNHVAVGYGDITNFYYGDVIRDGVKGLGIYFSAIQGNMVTKRISGFLPETSSQDFYKGFLENRKFEVIEDSSGEKRQIRLHAQGSLRRSPVWLEMTIAGDGFSQAMGCLKAE